MLRALPDAVTNLLVPTRLGFDAAAPKLTVPQQEIRLYIGPANAAGQGWQWARAVERTVAGAGATSMSVIRPGDFRYPSDYAVSIATYAWSRRWQTRQARDVTERYTHVLVESEQGLFRPGGPRRVRDEVRRLRRRGVEVAFLCHGSDIRLPSRHACSEPDSPFLPNVWDLTPELERQALANAVLLRELQGPLFVSTPDLLLDVPHATWLPVVLQPDDWSGGRPPLTGEGPPVVVHAPSRAVVKGSDLIDPVLRRLDDEGLIRYRLLRDVKAADMPAAYGDADIVLDQFRLGSYGVAAVEAMAAGRIVVSHVSDFVRSYVRSATGDELPIVQARAADLDGVLRGILARPQTFRATAAAGVDFVGAVHDGRLSAEALRPFLERDVAPGDDRSDGIRKD